MPPDEDGSAGAMGQVGEWVRFADAKAGLIAAAALGVLAVAAGQADDVASAIRQGGGWALSAWILVAVCTVLVSTTFWFVLEAVVPRPKSASTLPNRFAWPALARMNLDALRRHIEQTDLNEEAWAQTKSLADIAAAKYSNCSKALVALVFFVVASIGLVGVSAAAGAVDIKPPDSQPSHAWFSTDASADRISIAQSGPSERRSGAWRVCDLYEGQRASQHR